MNYTKKRNYLFTILLSVFITVFLVILIFAPKNIFNNSKVIPEIYQTGGSGRGTEGNTRETYNFNFGWTFSKGTGKNNAGSSYNSTTLPVQNVTCIPNPIEGTTDVLDIPYNSSYDPTHYASRNINECGDTWQEVSLPHTYNDKDTFDNFMEGSQNGERTLYSGTAWYKKTFNLPESYVPGKRVIIEFEAARQAAKIWVNGQAVEGTYENGFIAFGYDITPYLNYTEGLSNENVITVMVDNSFPYKLNHINNYTGTSNVSWHDPHWHPNYGGLYRNSYLYVVDDLHLTLPLYSFTQGSGTYIYTDNETTTTAEVRINAEVKNDSEVQRTFDYKVTIKDPYGNIVPLKDTQNNVINSIESTTSLTLDAGQTTTLDLSGIIYGTYLKRWSDKYPYLYSCEVELLDPITNDVIDNNLNTFGIRTFKFTNDYGFYLNEYYTVLNGWGQKSTWEWATLGAAYPDWMVEYGIKLVKDAHGNYIRFGHTSGSPTQINMCDRYGILVTQPGVDGEGESPAAGNNNAYDDDTYRLRFEAMRDMLIYYRNHPSIIMWEIGNQALGTQKTTTDVFNSTISWMEYPTNTVKKYAEVLVDIINKYDYGNRNDDASDDNVGTHASAATSSNRAATIRRSNAQTDNVVDVLETTQGDGEVFGIPLIEGEYLRTEARRGMWDRSTIGFYDFTNTSTFDSSFVNETGESFAKNQVSEREQILSMTHYSGGANWIFSDTISHGRVTSEVARASGEVDATMLPKSAYYANKVIFDNNPGVYIIGHWNYEAGTVKDISVIANGVSKVELLIDGNTLGFGNASSNSKIFTFNNVTYSGNVLQAKGYDSSDNLLASYEVSKHGVPTHLEISGISGPTGLYATGSDVLILDVKLLDANNNVCISYDGEVDNKLLTITADVDDNGVNTGMLLGGYNSSVPENTGVDENGVASLYLEAGITRVFLRTSKNAGNISVNAQMDGIQGDTYETVSLSNTVTNGLSTLINPTSTFALDNTYDLPLGSGEIPQNILSGPVLALDDPYSRLLVENISYSGAENLYNAVLDAFSEGKSVYSDNGITFTDIPYKYINAEYLHLPNDDRGSYGDDFLVFEVTRNATVYVARDPLVANPNWLINDYTLTGDTLTTSDNKVYNIWKRDVVVSITNNEVTNQTIIIGGNSDTGIDGMNGSNQIVFVKETSDVNSRNFLFEDFDLFNYNSIFNGYKGYVINTTSVAKNSLTKEIIDDHISLRLFDSKLAGIVRVQKEFAPLSSDFIFEFKAYVKSKSNNKWNRIMLSNGLPADSTDGKTNIPVETYLDISGSSVILKSKSSGVTTDIIGVGNISVNAWYTYKYEVNFDAKKFVVKVYNSSDILVYETEEIAFNTLSTVREINYLTFGTGNGTSFDNEFYVDDVKVTPVMGVGADTITINGNIINLNKNTTQYIIVDNTLPSDATFSLQANDELYDSSYVVDDINKKITFDLENQNLEHFVFDIGFSSVSALDGWNISPSDTPVDPDAMVSSILKDNIISIHFNDASTTKSTFIYKEIEEVTTALKLSYDFYIDENVNFTQEMLRTFVTSGAMNDETNYDNVALRSYFTPQNGTSNEFVNVVQKIGTTDNYADNTNVDSTIITKNTWHNIEYELNVVKNTYDILLDGVKIFDDFPFYSDVSSIDHIYIGSSIENTASYYINNIEYELMGGYPLDGVTIDGLTLPEFDSKSDTYHYYTNEVLNNNTVINLSTNAFYLQDSSTIVLDTDNQRVVITLSDARDNVYTYTIIYEVVSNLEITKEQLEALYDRASLLESSSSNYTFNTWSIVEQEMEDTEAILAPGYYATPAEYTLAYLELDSAMSNLLTLCNYEDYETGLIETIQYSNNLLVNNEEVFKFNKVLDNNKEIYFENTFETFSSVPYKYLNAEYLVMDNENYTNGLIVLKTLRKIDLLIFKDRDAGPLNETGFTYTGEIATASNGTVYKIYKKDFDTVGENVNIEFEKLVNNYVTNKNNIVAIVNSDNVTNNKFFFEDFDEYDISSLEGYTLTDLFNRSWENIRSGEYDSIKYAENTLEDNIDARKAAYVYSRSISTLANTHAISIIFKEMAKLYETVEFKYSFKTITGTTPSGGKPYDNEYIRTWLRDAPALDDYETLTQAQLTTALKNMAEGSADKSHAAVELYIHGTAIKFQKENTALKDNSLGTVNANAWHNISIIIDLKRKKFKIKIDDNNYTQEYSTQNKTTVANGTNAALNFVNYVYFSSRFTGATNAYFTDIEVNPVNSEFLSSLKVSDSTTTYNISNYSDLTKAYLHKFSNVESYNDASLTAVATEGNLFTNAIADDNTITFSPTYLTSEIDNDKFTTVDETLTSSNYGNYERNYKIYYEVDSDDNDGTYFDTIDNITRVAHGKSDLVTLLRTAYNIDQSFYTTASYALLINAMNNAKTVLADHQAVVYDGNPSSTTDVARTYDALNRAIDGLIPLVDSDFTYRGKITPGSVYGTVSLIEPHVTTDSSVTASFELEQKTTGNYLYDGLVHSRYLLSNVGLSVGTKITMIDKSGIMDKYYYYIVNDNTKTRFALADFILAGTTDKTFDNAYHFNNNILKANYSFILDFSNTNSAEGTYNLALELNIESDETLVFTSTPVYYYLHDVNPNVSVQISTSSDSYFTNQSINLNTSFNIGNTVVNDINIINTTYQNKTLGARISLYDTDDNLISFSNGTKISVDDTIYSLSSDGYFRVPINSSISSFIKSFIIIPGYQSFPEGVFTFKVELLESYDGYNDTLNSSDFEILATDTEILSIAQNQLCSIDATAENNTNVLSKHLASSLNIDIKTVCNNISSDEIITLSLYKKTNSSFNDFSYTLIDYHNYVNNTVTTLYDTINYPNVYILKTYSYNSLNTSHDDRYQINFNNTLSPGMYRLKLDIRSSNIIQSDYLTFIVE